MAAMDGRWDSTELQQVRTEVWRALGEAIVTPAAPWRTPVIATAGDDGGGRIVVLRGAMAERRELVFYTDLRAPKVRALQKSPWLTWVFYSAEWQVQVRMRASARVHVGDVVAESCWAGVPEVSRANYGTAQAPGSRVTTPIAQQYLSGIAEENFAVVVTEVFDIDWLWLRREGHRRAGWQWSGSGWTGGWRTP